MSDMNKKKIVRKLAEKCGVSMVVAERVFCSSLEIIIDTLEAGNQVMLHKFGTFKTQVVAAHKGRNPKTGESVNIPSRRRAKFKPSKDLRERVNTE